MQNERRSDLRYLVDFPVQLAVADSGEEMEITGVAINLSQNSIQISCDRDSVSLLLSQAHYPPQCRLCFRLPGCECVVKGDGRLVGNRRLAENVHHLGFRFTCFEGQSKESLVDYFAACQNSG